MIPSQPRPRYFQALKACSSPCQSSQHCSHVPKTQRYTISYIGCAVAGSGATKGIPGCVLVQCHTVMMSGPTRSVATPGNSAEIPRLVLHPAFSISYTEARVLWQELRQQRTTPLALAHDWLHLMSNALEELPCLQMLKRPITSLANWSQE